MHLVKTSVLAVVSLLVGCASTPENDAKWAAIAAGLAGGAAAYNAGYNSVQPYQAVQDYQWAWDQFYNANYQLVWACRGVQTGQFADAYRCSGIYQSDWRWPQK